MACAEHGGNICMPVLGCAPCHPPAPAAFGIDAAWDKPVVVADPTKTQVGGSHYTRMKIQPMHYAMVNGFNALQFTVLKYISRYEHKGGLEDLQKARHAIDMLITHYTNKDTNAST